MEAIDLRRLDDEQANEWLNRQSEFYTHNQNQAYRLIQLVIGAGSILTILLTNSTSIISPLIDNSQNSILSGSVPSHIEQLTIQSGFVIGGCIAFLGALYVLDSVQLSFDVLQTPKPKPGLGGRSGPREIRIEVGEYESPELNQNQTMQHSQLSNWLNENKELLEEMDEKLNNSYKHLAIGVGMLFTASIILYTSYSGNSGSLSIMMVFILYFLNSFIKSMIIATWSILKETWRNPSQEPIHVRIQSFLNSIKNKGEMKGSKTGFFIIIQPVIYIQSLLTVLSVIVWFILPSSAY